MLPIEAVANVLGLSKKWTLVGSPQYNRSIASQCRAKVGKKVVATSIFPLIQSCQLRAIIGATSGWRPPIYCQHCCLPFCWPFIHENFIQHQNMVVVFFWTKLMVHMEIWNYEESAWNGHYGKTANVCWELLRDRSWDHQKNSNKKWVFYKRAYLL